MFQGSYSQSFRYVFFEGQRYEKWFKVYGLKYRLLLWLFAFSHWLMPTANSQQPTAMFKGLPLPTA
jgi:hypothetical protein